MNKFVQKFSPILGSFIAIIIFYSVRENFDGDLWHWMDAVVTIATVSGVWYNYNMNSKQLDEIKVSILCKGEEKEIPIYIIRKNFTRSEIKGIFGGLHDGKNFDIDYFDNSNSSFLKDIFEIQQGKRDKLTVIIHEKDNFRLK